jgi:hypothetical protein
MGVHPNGRPPPIPAATITVVYHPTVDPADASAPSHPMLHDATKAAPFKRVKHSPADTR